MAVRWDGPLPKPKELIAGYTLIQVRSEDSLPCLGQLLPRSPFPAMDCEIEVRRLYEDADFAWWRDMALR